jgi:CRISPR/Cas system-associated exonuclease Cas4 (RecB family)
MQAAPAASQPTQSQVAPNTGLSAGLALTRQTVLEVVEQPNPHPVNGGRYAAPELLVRLADKRTQEERRVRLRGSWLLCAPEVGDTVEVIGDYDESGVCCVDDERNFIIIEPDTLVTSTRVATSFDCLRKSVLSERFRSADSATPAMVYGTLLHEVFARCCLKNAFTVDAIVHAVDEVLPEFLDELYAIDTPVAAAREELLAYVPTLTLWAGKFMQRSRPEQQVNMDAQHDRNAPFTDRVSISRVLDIEENCWTPRLGLKGKVDASVEITIHRQRRGTMRQQAKEVVRTAPLELKTGRTVPHGSPAHRAQVILYTLMMGDLGTNLDAGLLYYMKSGDMYGVAVVADEVRHLLVARNRLARYLCKGHSYPPMLRQPSECGRCYHLGLCMLVHAGVEGGTAESSGAPALFKEQTRHLRAGDLAYLRKWHGLLALEQLEGHDDLTRLWEHTPWQLEQAGTCLSYLAYTGAPTVLAGSERRRHAYTFKRHPLHPAVSGVEMGNGMAAAFSTLPTMLAGRGAVRQEGRGDGDIELDEDDDDAALLDAMALFEEGQQVGLNTTGSSGDRDELNNRTYATRTVIPGNMQKDVAAAGRCCDTRTAAAHPDQSAVTTGTTGTADATSTPAATQGRCPSMAELQLAAGDPVILSAQRPAHFAMALGIVRAISHEEVQVAFEHPLRKLDSTTLYRLDKDPGTVGGRLDRANVASLLQTPADAVQAQQRQASAAATVSAQDDERSRLYRRRRSVLIDMAPPIFSMAGVLAAGGEAVLQPKEAKPVGSEGNDDDDDDDLFLSEVAEAAEAAEAAEVAAAVKKEADSLLGEHVGGSGGAATAAVDPMDSDAEDDDALFMAAASAAEAVIEKEARAADVRQALIQEHAANASAALAPHERAALAEVMPLNEGQCRALTMAVRARDYCLIQGMPGTGKTTTIAALVKVLVAKGNSVLLTAYTHTAVDNILIKLKAACIPFLRLGNPERVHPAVRDAVAAGHIPHMSDISALKKLYHDKPVIATTCLGTGHALLHKRIFDYCIVDEASQISEPVCLGPLACARRFVLVGDHFQLPPLVRNVHARREGLDVSLFKRLTEAHPYAVTRLEQQYRMNAEIMLAANTLIYDHALRCGNVAVARARLHLASWRAACDAQGSGRLSLQARLPASLQPLIDPAAPLLLADTAALGMERRQGKLVTHPEEAALVVALSQALLAAGLAPSELGIITPYRSQVRLLHQLMHDPHMPTLANVEINTIDKYQGRDKECILLSLVRSNKELYAGELLKDWRRINVALTRAKHKLVVFGDVRTLSVSHLCYSWSFVWCWRWGRGGQKWRWTLPGGVHVY